MRQSFWGTVAPSTADFVLLLEFVMALALLAGARLARLGRFRQHVWCQSIIVLTNLVVILLSMVPSFSVQVYPRIPAKLGKSYYALATTHAVLGSVTELAALYILLAAGTDVLPKRFRIEGYKVWMRSVVVLWWAVLLLGVATYIRWYVPQAFRR